MAPRIFTSADMWTAAGERISAQQSFKKDAPEDIRALYQKHAMGNSLFRNSGAASRTFETRPVGWRWNGSLGMVERLI